MHTGGLKSDPGLSDSTPFVLESKAGSSTCPLPHLGPSFPVACPLYPNRPCLTMHSISRLHLFLGTQGLFRANPAPETRSQAHGMSP